MPLVGDASVVVRAITDRVKSDIERAFKDAKPVVQTAGKDHAKAYGDAFKSQLKSSLTGSGGIGSILNDPASAKQADEAGKNIGRAYASGIRSEVGKLDLGGLGEGPGRELGDEIVDGASDAIDDGGAKIGRSAERALGNAGGRGGSAFRRALDSEFSEAAQRTSRGFTAIYAASSLASPAIAGLVSSLSAAVSGLYAMASAASVAAGSLAVLPGAASVAAQSIGTLRLAFGGVSDALSAGLKEATESVGAAGGAAASNAYAVADAQKALARARQDAADAAADAAERVADAERDVLDAQTDVLRVQKELTQARREAAESLQQLGFDAEDAALAEQRAAMNLEDAHAQLLAVQNLPADDRTRREAELAYQETELAYRQAKDRAADLAKEQKAAAKAGVEGTDEMVDARRKVADAEETLIEKQRAAHEAREDAARQARDSAQSIADAQEAVRRAQESATAAIAKGTTAQNAYNEALKNLSPQARAFVEYLVSLRGEIGALRAAAGTELFPKLEGSLRPIIEEIFPVLEEQLKTTGGLLGDAALGFSQAITSAEGVGRIRNILGDNNEILATFTKRGEDGRNTFSRLATVILRVLDAVQPLTRRFAVWIDSLVRGADAATNSREEMNRLRGFFDKAGDRAAQLGRILGNLFGILFNVGKAADKSGASLLDSFEGATEALEKFTGKASTQRRLNKYFEDAADNLRDIGDLLVVIGDEFLQLGDNRGAGEFATSLIPAIKNLGEMGDRLTDASPELGKFAEEVTRIMLAFTDSGSIKIFLRILTAVAGTLADMLNSGPGRKILIIAGSVAAVTRAFSVLSRISGFVFRLLVGGPLRVVNAFSKMFAVNNRILKSWQGLRRGTLTLREALQNIVFGSDKAKAAFERQMVTDRQKVAALKLVEEQSDRTALALQRVKTAGAPAAGAAAAPVRSAASPAAAAGARPAALAATPAAARGITATGTAAVKAAGPLSKLGSAFSALSLGLLGVSGPILAIIAGVVLLGVFFKKLYDHSPEFRKFIDGIVDKVKELGHWVGEIFTKYVFPAFNTFFGWVNDNLPAVGEKIVWVFKNLILPYIKIFVKVWSTYFKIIFTVYKTMFEALRKVVTSVFIPLIQGLVIPWLKILWIAFSTYYKLIWSVVKVAFNLIKGYVTSILIPTFENLVIPAIQLVWEVAKKIFGYIVARWKNVWTAVKAIFNKVIKPLFNALMALFNLWWTTTKKIIGFIWDRFMWLWDKTKIFRDGIRTIFSTVKDIFVSLSDKIGQVFGWIADKLKTFYGKFVEFKNDVKDVVSDIKGFFSTIGDGVAAAFTGLIAKVKDPLREFIKFLNDNLIGNINTVTKKFGLTIPTIPIGFEKGGWTGPGPAKRVAGIVHADEHVIRKSSRRKLEASHPGALDYMNKYGQLPPGIGGGKGGWGPLPDLHLDDIVDFAGDTIGGIKNIGEKIAKEGLGKVLEALVNAATSGMSGAGIKRGLFINDFFYAIMDKLADHAKAWGGKEGATASGTLQPPRSSGGSYLPYNGPADGWTNPMGGPYVITQYPNSGHSPSWAIDLAAAAGTLVRAASSGNLWTGWGGDDSYGNYAVITHLNGVQTLYAHLLEFIKRSGRVRAGQIIGKVGSTGNSSGNHLHFEYKPSSDTRAAMRAHGVYLAKGGVVSATPGGVHAVIAEAGRSERVEPLDNRGMSKRDQAMLEEIRAALSQGGNGDTFKIYPSQGMNEAELAQLVSRRVAWRRTVGT